MANGVKFIRKNGRVIPIREKSGGMNHGPAVGKKLNSLPAHHRKAVGNALTGGMVAGFFGASALGAHVALKSKSKVKFAAGIAMVIAAPVVGAFTGAAGATATQKYLKHKDAKKNRTGV